MRLLALLCLVLSLEATAQDMLEADRTSKFQIGLNASAELPFRRIHSIHAIEDTAIMATNIKRAERPAISYSSGLRICYSIQKNVELEMGFGYHYKAFNIDWSKIRFIRPSNAPIWYYDPRPISDHWNVRYFEMPVKLNLILGSGKVRSISSVGASYSFSHSIGESALIDEIGLALDVTGLSDQYIAAIISSGAEIKLGQRGHLRVEPTLNYGITQFTEGLVQTKLWTIGTNFGYYWRF